MSARIRAAGRLLGPPLLPEDLRYMSLTGRTGFDRPGLTS